MTPRQDIEPPTGPSPAAQTQPSPHLRRAQSETAWPWWSVASILLLVLIALAGAGVSLAYTLRTPPATVWPTTVLVTVTPQVAPTQIVVTGVAPTPIVWPNVTRYVRVIGTQGLSLRIRSAPSAQAETIKLVQDGARLLVTGDGRQADGSLWWPVRDPTDNQAGWAVSTYLVPATEP